MWRHPRKKVAAFEHTYHVDGRISTVAILECGHRCALGISERRPKHCACGQCPGSQQVGNSKTARNFKW